MNWEGIQPTSREKVESLIEAFNAFVLENHSGIERQDQKVKNEWENFKKLIGTNPADTQAQNNFVLTLRNNLLKEQVTRNKHNPNKRQLQEQQTRPPIKIDKNKLISICRQLRRQVLRNSRDPLDMLE